jgi:hypothetical protein
VALAQQIRGKPTTKLYVALDWDGTLAQSVFPECGDLLPGAVEFVKRLQRRGFTVVIHSCRAGYLRDAIQNKLDEAGLRNVEISVEKPQAVAYVDDRGVRFQGDFEAAFDAVLELQREQRRADTSQGVTSTPATDASTHGQGANQHFKELEERTDSSAPRRA